MKIFIFIFVFIFNFCAHSQIIKEYKIGDTDRKTIMYEPVVKSGKVPVLFVFHGHGGNANYASKRFDFQNYYKDALVIYMEGMPGRKVSGLDPNGKMNGWQIFPNELENRDINFFDEVLNDIHKKYNVDDARIYLVGHSNGARFVNVLWKERGSYIAAICSASAQGGNMISGANPISVWMYMGKNDRIVSYDSQKNSISIVKENLGITHNGKQNGDKTVFSGKNNTELIVQESNSGHEFPKESIPEIIAFFKRHTK